MSKQATTEAPKIIRGFKALDKNLQCRGHQYEVSKTYKEKGEISLIGFADLILMSATLEIFIQRFEATNYFRRFGCYLFTHFIFPPSFVFGLWLTANYLASP